jgi:hypothetical protein
VIRQKKLVILEQDPFGKERTHFVLEQEGQVDLDKLYYLENLYLMVMVSMKSFLDN